MKTDDVRKITEMLDEVIRGRRGAGLFTDLGPTNVATLWMAEIRKVGDAEVATKAVAVLFSDTPAGHVPTPADFRSAVSKIRKDMNVSAPALGQDVSAYEMPDWAAAKFLALYEGDNRVWPPQESGYDALQLANPHNRTYVWGEQEQMPSDVQEEYLGRVANMTGEQRAALMRSALQRST